MAFDPDEVVRDGVFVTLGHDGQVRIERGLIRPEDEPPVVEAEPEPEGEELAQTAGEGGEPAPSEMEPDDDPATPLSERLVLELTAYRTMGLHDAMAGDPTLALTALVHALALKAFYPPYEQASCVEVKLVSAFLDGHAGRRRQPGGAADRGAAWGLGGAPAARGG